MGKMTWALAILTLAAACAVQDQPTDVPQSLSVVPESSATLAPTPAIADSDALALAESLLPTSANWDEAGVRLLQVREFEALNGKGAPAVSERGHQRVWVVAFSTQDALVPDAPTLTYFAVDAESGDVIDNGVWGSDAPWTIRELLFSPASSDEGSHHVMGDIYAYPDPPPTWTVTPTPTRTPTPLPNGLLPPPSNMPISVITVSQSEHRSTLSKVKNAVDSRDGKAVAGLFNPWETVVVGDWQRTYVNSSNVAPTFETLYENGSVPVIQGYFVAHCRYVFVTGWVGDAALPALWKVESMDGRMRWLEGIGGAAYAWTVCDHDGEPRIDSWRSGNYYEIVSRRYKQLLDRQSQERQGLERSDPVTFFVLEPE